MTDVIVRRLRVTTIGTLPLIRHAVQVRVIRSESIIERIRVCVEAFRIGFQINNTFLLSFIALVCVRTCLCIPDKPQLHMIPGKTTYGVHYCCISLICGMEIARCVGITVKIIAAVNTIRSPSPPRRSRPDEGVHAERIGIRIGRFAVHGRPVIRCSGGHSVEYITIQVPMTRSPRGSTGTRRLYRYKIFLRLGCVGTYLIVIIDEITFVYRVQPVIFAFFQFSCVFSSIAAGGTALVVVLHIIDIVDIYHPVITLRAIETARTGIIIHQQVMMVRSRGTSPLATVRARLFRVTGIIESFMDNAILHREKMTVIRVHILLCGPAEIAMVEDIVLAVFCANSVGFEQITVHIRVSYTETQVADDEVLRPAELHFVVRNDNTHTRRRLTGEGEVLASVEIEPVHQPDLARYGETDRERFIRILLDCPTETAFSHSFLIVRKGRDIDDLAATSSGSVFTESFCARKRHYRIRQQGSLSPREGERHQT